MIIRETEREFVMIQQHDHANLSGEAAKHFKASAYVDPMYREGVLLAVTEHDRSWIRLDETPIWNDKDQMPFSFNDYPLLPKLTLYKQGIDEVELRNPYAALLCSLHYASFQIFQTSNQPECLEFYGHELERQAKIKKGLGALSEETIHSHYQLLQLCDDISLYVCLNQPGADKEQEHPWYRAGFKNSELITGDPNRKMIANWVNEKEIRITPSPYQGGFSAKLKLKRVPKWRIADLGIGNAFKHTALEEQEIIFLG